MLSVLRPVGVKSCISQVYGGVSLSAGLHPAYQGLLLKTTRCKVLSLLDYTLLSDYQSVHGDSMCNPYTFGEEVTQK